VLARRGRPMKPALGTACKATVLALTLLLPTPARAGDLQDQMESRWRGAWIVTGAETYADCAGPYTGNRVNGRLVSGRGGNRFRIGELAKVDSIDLKRSRLDLRLTLAEPLLVSHQEGPFVLYDEARCRVELQVEIPRDMVKRDDVNGMEGLIKPVLDRYVTEDAARASARYNRREREAYPRDYDNTLAQYAVWRAQQTNAAVQARMDRLVDETSRIPERITGDPDYMAGFVKGVESGRAPHSTQCPDLMRSDAVAARTSGSSTAAYASTGDKQDRSALGYQDGLRLTLGLDALRRLPQCFVPVPPAAK